MAPTPDRAAFARQYLQEVGKVIAAVDSDALAAALKMFDDARTADRQVFIAGNGGSASTASHMVNDLCKTIAKGHNKGMRATALGDNVSLVTAIGNDVGYDHIFSLQLKTSAREGDLLVVFSCSGNSPNIVRAVETAKELGLHTVAFLGRDGGAVKTMADVAVVAPHKDYGPIEDLHLIFNHLVTAFLLRP